MIKKYFSVILCISIIPAICAMQTGEQTRSRWTTITQPFIALKQLITRTSTAFQAPRISGKPYNQALQECRTAPGRIFRMIITRFLFLVGCAGCIGTWAGYKLGLKLGSLITNRPNFRKLLHAVMTAGGGILAFKSAEAIQIKRIEVTGRELSKVNATVTFLEDAQTNLPQICDIPLTTHGINQALMARIQATEAIPFSEQDHMMSLALLQRERIPDEEARRNRLETIQTNILARRRREASIAAEVCAGCLTRIINEENAEQ